MSRWLKIPLISIGVVLLLVVLFWMGIAIYVNVHKKEVLSSITEQLNENINGVLTIESMEPTLVRGFPGISISLENVLLRDTLYKVHHHDLLRAKEINVTVNAFSILKGSPRIRDIRINDGFVYLFTDSTGYSNTNLFQKKATRDSSGKKTPPRLNHFFFNNVKFVLENQPQHKIFRFDIDRLEGKLDYIDTGWVASVKVKTRVGDLDFYTKNGPFLKNKYVTANLEAHFNDRKKILNIPLEKIKVEGNAVYVGATFDLSHDPATYTIDLKADDIGYQEGRSFLSTHLQQVLSIVDLKEPVNVQVTLKGSTKKRDMPLVYVRWQVKDNTIVGAGNTLEHCTFTGYFYNQYHKEREIGDENSVIAVRNFKGSWQEIDFRADTVRIENLKSPVLYGRFKSDFELSKLNEVITGNTFRFDKGMADLDLVYKGGISNNDTTQPYIIGDVHLKEAGITYIPRRLVFTNGALTLNFRGNDLFVKNVKLQNGANVIYMDGSMRNFLNLYYTAPDKILLDWNIRSPQINLDQYRNFLEARSATAAAAPKKVNPSKSVNHMSQQLDQVLERSSVRMRLQVNNLLYQKFTASDINADLSLSQAGIQLKDVSVRHAGGKVQLNGNINQNGRVNTFAVNAKVDNVHVNEFFYAFGNFGQEAVTEKNIQGELFAKMNLTGAITDKGTLVPQSLNGTVDFDLRNGALIEFAPLKNIGRYVFRQRNLSHITFTNLKDQLDIKGDLITIHPMYIESNAINVNVAGLYSFGKGTDIRIDVPLRNPKNDGLILDDSVKQGKRMKGIVVHLNVVDGENGKVKIKLVGKNKGGVAAVEGEEVVAPVEKKKRKGWFRR